MNKIMMNQKILALDFGLQRVGVAVSHASLAEPVTILTNDATLLSKIKELCQEHGVTRLVVGLSEGKMAELSRAFAQEVSAQLNLPVDFIDETLTSRTVTDKLHAAGKRRARVDDLAAAEFLQEYLDEKTSLDF